MLGFKSAKPIAEHEASGEIERVYHEIKQTLRVTGVNLNFRTWATFGDFLPLIWDTLRPSIETMAFEAAADRVREEAAEHAESLGPLDVPAQEVLGESQLYQLRGSLDLYHYINPKLLVFSSATAMLLRGEEIGSASSLPPERVALGAPRDMLDLEMEDEDADDPQIETIFADIKDTLALPSVNSDYRTLALWPDYLSLAWQRLKPLTQSSAYGLAADQLREASRRLARELPYKVSIVPNSISDAGADLEKVIEKTDSFERLLPGLIINIALLQLDWRQGSELNTSPFTAQLRETQSGEQA